MIKLLSLVMFRIAHLILLTLVVNAYAQEKSAQTPDEIAFTIPHKTGNPEYGGKTVYLEGVAGAKIPHHFALEGLSINQPIVVAVQAKDPKKKILLSANKIAASENATPKGKSSVSGDDGRAMFSFRAQGEVRITVLAETSTAYQLMVWVGPDIRLPLESPFKPVSSEQLRKIGGQP